MSDYIYVSDADRLEAKDKRIEELEAEVKHTEELHAAILALIGSEGMTDAKFVQWVEKALAAVEEKDDD